MKIGSEQRGDETAIHHLTLKAFELMPFSNGSEPFIVDQLREDQDLTLSLVMEDHGEIIAHVAFSPVTINGNHAGWYGLGPVSVRPDLQKQGIGKALINEGLSRMRGQEAVGCALIGDPNYYRRFGFRSDGNLTYGNVPPEVVQWLPFGTNSAHGVLKFAPAFERDY